MAPNYLAPLAPTAEANGDVPLSPDCYASMSRGLQALYAERDAKRDLLVARCTSRSRASADHRVADGRCAFAVAEQALMLIPLCNRCNERGDITSRRFPGGIAWP